MDNDEKERDITSCYGTDCGHCSEPCELRDCGMDVIREKQEEANRSNSRSLRYNDAIETKSEELCDINWQNDDVLYALNRLVHLYKEYPVIFNALIDHLWDNKTQSDVARERGITRQAVSKERKLEMFSYMAAELGMKAPVVRREKLLELTGKEFEVYKKLFIDGCTERSTAIQLGISKSTVHDIGQNLRKKLAKNRARKRTVQKKS